MAFCRDYDRVFPTISELMKDKPVTIVDVGANIGTTVICFKLVYPDAKVIAIEPFPKNIPYLRKNTAHLSDITIIEKAASDHTGILNMSCESDNTGLAKVVETGIEVECDTLDNMVDSCDLIKIDVEGHEEYVFHGATRLIKTKPMILVETRAPKKFRDVYENHKRISKNDYVFWNGEKPPW